MEKLLKRLFLKLLIFLKRNLYTVIFINILLIFFAPWIFTRKWNILDFTETGPIGDTIGGITAPFINVLNAVLIFLAFKEQKDANDILRNQNKHEREKQEQKLIDVKNLILYDLEYRIRPDLIRMIPEIDKTLMELEEDFIKQASDYVDFNDKIYLSNELSDYSKIFNKDIEDLKSLIHIYNRVNFVFKHTPLQLSYKYPTDKGNIVFLNTLDINRDSIILRHKAKKKIELEQLIINIKSLLNLVNDFIAKYKSETSKSNVDMDFFEESSNMWDD